MIDWLDFFHSSAVKINLLIKIWLNILLETNLGYKVNGRLIILGDGIKAPMPAVKSLHQESEANSKAEFIIIKLGGHSFQVLSLLTSAFGYFFATPIIGQIHEGIVESNNDKRTLLDKMILMLNSLAITQPFYFICDSYYSSRKIILPLLNSGQHLITRVKSNSVAYIYNETKKAGRGRPRLYGTKIRY